MLPRAKVILKTFCCGFHLRTGTLIFAVLSLIFVILPVTSILYDEESEIQIHTGIVLGIIYCLFSAVICIAAIVGAYKKKYELLAPFIVFSVISLTVSLISFILTIFLELPIVPQDTILFFMKKVGMIGTRIDLTPYFIHSWSYVLFLLLWVITIAIIVYFILISYSYYCHLVIVTRSRKKKSSAIRFKTTPSTPSTFKTTPKAAAKTKPKITPKAAAKTTPKAAAKTTPKAASKTTPKAAPKTTPKAAAKTTKKAATRVSPKKTLTTYTRVFYNPSKNQQDDRSNSEVVILE